MTFDLRLTSGTGYLVVTMAGDLDIASIEPIQERLLTIATTVPGVVFVDLGDVRFLDSCGCGLFIQMHNTLVARGHVLVLANVGHSVGKPLQILGIDRLIPTSYTDQPARPWTRPTEAERVLDELTPVTRDTETPIPPLP